MVSQFKITACVDKKKKNSLNSGFFKLSLPDSVPNTNKIIVSVSWLSKRKRRNRTNRSRSNCCCIDDEVCVERHTSVLLHVTILQFPSTYKMCEDNVFERMSRVPVHTINIMSICCNLLYVSCLKKLK